MKYYSVRKSKNLNILVFNSNFIDLVKDANGWKINTNKEYAYTPAMKSWNNFKI